MLKQLGEAIEQHPEFFETGGVFRPGNMVDYLRAQAESGTKVHSDTYLMFEAYDWKPNISISWRHAQPEASGWARKRREGIYRWPHELGSTWRR